MYLTQEATTATLAGFISRLAPVIMSFVLPFEKTEAALRLHLERAAKGAHAEGTPWMSFSTPEDMVGMALRVGFAKAGHAPAAKWTALYFGSRNDGLRPAQGEGLLVASHERQDGNARRL